MPRDQSLHSRASSSPLSPSMSSRTRSCRDWLTSQRCRMCRMAAPQKRALMCFLFSSVNTSDCSRTSAHPLHRGCYNTRPLQGFLQEASNLQLESHRPTSERVPQLHQRVAKRQFCTSNTGGEGDGLVLGKGDRVTPQRPVSHLGTGQLQQMPPHRKEHL